LKPKERKGKISADILDPISAATTAKVQRQCRAKWLNNKHYNRSTIIKDGMVVQHSATRSIYETGLEVYVE
jgi:hypothetical protein